VTICFIVDECLMSWYLQNDFLEAVMPKGKVKALPLELGATQTQNHCPLQVRNCF